MQEKRNNLLADFNRLYKEEDELYHKVASKMGVPDSVFSIFYLLNDLGEGCMQKDICYAAFVNKQTVNSSVRKMVADGYIYLKQGRGRDKHIFLTEAGKQFVQTHIVPVVQKENDAFMNLAPEEQNELLRLVQKYIKSLKEKLNEIEARPNMK